ncbi:MAG TPA: hypothetical protein VE978_26000 [Chitinophagales bacterium]|nr:hypothetical protein [Chitinophagales bacterium]
MTLAGRWLTIFFSSSLFVSNVGFAQREIKTREDLKLKGDVRLYYYEDYQVKVENGQIVRNDKLFDRIFRGVNYDYYVFDRKGRVIVERSNYHPIDGSHGIENRYRYNWKGKITRMELYSSTGKLLQVRAYHYNIKGDWVRGYFKELSDTSTGSIIITYDSRGRRVSDLYTQGNSSEIKSYTYDEKGNKIMEVSSFTWRKKADTIQYTYDSMGRLTGEFTGHNKSPKNIYEYDESGKMVLEINFFQGEDRHLKTQYYYNSDGSMREKKVTSYSHSNFSICNYMYDSRINVIAETCFDTLGKQRHSYCYQYDDANHLLEKDFLEPTGEETKRIYKNEYDSHGNCIYSITYDEDIPLSVYKCHIEYR